MEARKILLYLALKHRGDWEKIYEDISNKVPLDEMDVVNKLLSNVKSNYITLLDENYPEHLKHLFRPPFVLFYHGDLSLIKDKSKCISVVGSRENSEYGEKATKFFVRQLAKDFVIVSGLARGIDGISHATALESGGKTVAVLGSGINTCYPVSNKDLYNEIRRKGLIISEYPNCTPPSPNHFPVRNRIVAALSCCLLVTEGERNSGTSITATLTLEHGGNVCCVPTRFGENSVCNYLIANGAALVETVQDIFDEIGYAPHKDIF